MEPDETMRRAVAAMRTGPISRSNMNAAADLIIDASLARDTREQELEGEVVRLRRLLLDIRTLAEKM